MDRYLISLGPFNITWYAFFIVFAMLIGAIIILMNKHIRKINKNDLMYDYFFWLVIWSFLGARTWYVLFDLNYYLHNLSEIIKIWHGGLAIHGALLFGGVYTYYFARKHYINFFLLTDALIPALLLGQSIGRWGNFVNQEAHGPATTFDFLRNTLHLPIFIVNGMQIDGVYYQPTFLYESFWNFLGFLIVILILKNIHKVNDNFGFISAFYLAWYGFIRTIIEQFRTDALMFGPIRVAQLASICMFIAGIIIFTFLLKKYYRGEGDLNDKRNIV